MNGLAGERNRRYTCRPVVIEGELLERFVPHRGRMSLLTRVVQYDLSSASLAAEVDIRESDLFFDGERGGVPAWVGFEYMAQSIAALAGSGGGSNWRRSRASASSWGCATSGSARRCSAGGKLRVEVRQVFKDGDVVSFDCSIGENGTELVRGIINAIEAGDGLVPAIGSADG